MGCCSCWLRESSRASCMAGNPARSEGDCIASGWNWPCCPDCGIGGCMGCWSSVSWWEDPGTGYPTGSWSKGTCCEKSSRMPGSSGAVPCSNSSSCADLACCMLLPFWNRAFLEGRCSCPASGWPSLLSLARFLLWADWPDAPASAPTSSSVLSSWSLLPSSPVFVLGALWGWPARAGLASETSSGAS